MGLLDFLKKKKAHIISNGNLDKLTPDGELPYGWYYANKDFTQRIEDEYRRFSDAVYEAKKEGVRAEYNALASLVQYMEDVRKLCESKGEFFVEWASVMVVNPTVYQQEKERLQYMETNLPALLQQEEVLKNLRKDILQIIEHTPRYSSNRGIQKVFP